MEELRSTDLSIVKKERTFEFGGEEIYSSHPDWLSVYEGEMYFGIQPLSKNIEKIY